MSVPTQWFKEAYLFGTLKIMIKQVETEYPYMLYLNTVKEGGETEFL